MADGGDKGQLDNVQHSVPKDHPQDEDDLSHMEVIVQVQEHIKKLLKDPFLSDFPSEVSLDKVQSQLALEEGRAITVNIRRYDDIIIPVIVLQGATVNDLIIAFQKEMIRRCTNEGKTTYISWRYVWRTYWLLYQQQKLRNRDAKLTSYGISNNDELTFVKKLKNEEYPSTRRQHYQNRGRGRKMTRNMLLTH